MSMNTDKAYIFGLIIGGGTFGNSEDTFYIRLPYRQWGSYELNPQRASQISRDIMKTVSPMFRSIYGIIVSFEATTREWRILCEGDLTDLKTDLRSYGIECEGELRRDISISGIVDDLADDFIKRRFIAGLADTIGSTTRSHRRFSDAVQTLSFEIRGFNFSFICELCRLLHDVKCYPDQILWNHPNFHATRNSYYTSWTKGTKLRVALDQYSRFGAFAFKTKVESSQENLSIQPQSNTAIPCPDREVRASMSCVHPAEKDPRLPDCVRDGHYLHNRHVCAVLGCQHAPYGEVKGLFLGLGDLIIPFPILCKDTYLRIEERIKDNPLLSNRSYNTSRMSVSVLYSQFQNDRSMLLYGDGRGTGYPITNVLEAVAYIIASDNELSGTRLKGSYFDVVERHLKADDTISVEIRRPDLLTPLVIAGNGRAALIGACNPSVYEKLVSFAPDNEYKLVVREITEGDLR
jgi:hypothetical protein